MCMCVPHAQLCMHTAAYTHLCVVWLVACTLKLIKYMHLTQNEASNGENQLQTDSQIMSRKNRLVAMYLH